MFLLLPVFFLILGGVSHAGDGGGIIQAETVQFNLNMIWVLVSAVLVFFMQAGFMCLESGLTEAKNSINVAIKNLADFVIATLLFWGVGFGIMFGDSLWGIIGTSGCMMDSSDPWRTVFFIFQTVFAGTAATITSGAVAGRTKFGGYLFMSLIISVLIYPVFGHWAWGGLLSGTPTGWLEKMGFIDFAGSTVVHSVGGWVALAGIIVVGARRNKFDEKGHPVEIQPHSMVMAFLGTFILFLGWFGFNCGSTLAASAEVAGIAMNTLLSACCGCLSISVVSWLKSPTQKPEAEMICNGILGGLVGITAGCASVSPISASIIGLASGVIVYITTIWLERAVKLDDVVGAVSVHGVCGAWGTLAAGIFISPEHLGQTSRIWQIAVQAIGVTACFGWTFPLSMAVFSLMHKVWGLRVSDEDERIGLNVSEHGAKSTLLDLTAAMNHVTINKDYSPDLKVRVERGSEMGDLALGFNSMLDAVRLSVEKVTMQGKIAEDARAEALSALKDIEIEKQKAEEASALAIQESDKFKFAMKKLSFEQEKTLEKQAVLKKVLRDAVSLSDSAIHGITEIVKAGERVSSGIGELGVQSREIITVVDMISSIADETNLLSLNATIEAVRSKGAGNGFKVIAGEIKELSRTTKQGAKRVAEMTGAFSEHFDTLVTHMKDQDSMGQSHTIEINRFQKEFTEIIESAGINMAGETVKAPEVLAFTNPRVAGVSA
ncbi:MAG: ammonium transporter [Desulfobacteraceae bacterium]|nr:ammonium transporter [Desulfobacteraceae bacterium]